MRSRFGVVRCSWLVNYPVECQYLVNNSATKGGASTASTIRSHSPCACPPPTGPKPTSSRTASPSLKGALDWARRRRRRHALGAGRARQAAAVLGDGKPAARVPDLQRRGPGADAAGRSAAARARRRDRDRAHRRPARPRRLRRRAPTRRCRACPRSAIALSKKFLPDGDDAARPAGSASARRPWSPRRCARCSCWAASSCSARPSTRRWARPDRRTGKHAAAALQLRHAGRRRAHRRRCAALPRQLRQRDPVHRRPRADSAGTPEHNDGISIKLSALHPRYEDAQRERVLRELVPRVWQLCELAARRQPQPHHRRRGESTGSSSRSTCSRRWPRGSRPSTRSGSGFGLALQAYQTRALELVEHVAAHRAQATGCASCAGWSRAPTGTPRSSARRSWACRTTRCSRTSTTPTSATWPARARCWPRPTRSTRSSRRTTPAPSRRSCRWRARTARRSSCSACTAWARASTAR